jgi:hypothetical protein
MCDSLNRFSCVTTPAALPLGGCVTTRARNAVTRRSPIARIGGSAGPTRARHGNSAVGGRFSSIGGFAAGIRRAGDAS